MLRKKLFIFAIVAFILSISISRGVPASAAPTPPNWTGIFTIKSSVPFVWLRNAPSSYAQVLTTLYPPNTFIASASPNGDRFIWDGVQWWGYVNLPMTVTTGWVEVNSLVQATSSTVTPTAQPTSHESWTTASVLKVKDQIIYVWLRAAPNSYAGALTSVGATTLLKVTNDSPVFDGFQWWWQVKYAGNGITGWVEQQSLALTPGAVVTEPPKPTAQPWVVGAKVRVKLNIPYSWLRNTYSSWAAVNFVATTGQVLVVSAGGQYDGIQWWWQVTVPGTQLTGWVEQNSLEADPGSPIIVPTPTSPLEVVNVIQEAAAYQTYQHGFMIWDSSDETVYVMNDNGQWTEYIKSQYANLPDNPVADNVPTGLIKPVRGFGRVWGNFHEVREALGWATGAEQAYTVTVRTPAITFHFFYMSLPDAREIRLLHETNSASWSFSNK